MTLICLPETGRFEGRKSQWRNIYLDGFVVQRYSYEVHPSILKDKKQVEWQFAAEMEGCSCFFVGIAKFSITICMIMVL